MAKNVNPSEKRDAEKRALKPHQWIEVLNNSLKSYEDNHPHWHLEVLVSLIKWGLRNLKHFIEDERNKKITWNDPLVELHYPVTWDWKSLREGDLVHGKQVLGTLQRKCFAACMIVF